MPFFTILDLDNPDGKITVDYVEVTFTVTDCINHLKKVPYEPAVCEVMASNTRGGFKFTAEDR
jgi:hypothetical protein